MAPEPDLRRGFDLGPFLAGAFVCEEVLEEKSGVLSIIRVVDRITFTAQGPGSPEQMIPFAYNFCLVVMLKTGANAGTFRVGVQPIKPNNERLQMIVHTVNLESPGDRGANVIAKIMGFPFDMPGVWWFDITLNEVKLTRIPLRIIYLQQPILGST